MHHHRDAPHSGLLLLDRFTNYLQIHRGVRAVMHKSFHLLINSEVKDILNMSRTINMEAKVSRCECASLMTLLSSRAADVDMDAWEAVDYQRAVSQLQWTFDLEWNVRTPEAARQLLSAWVIIVPPEYITLLLERRAEALVILAYYAVLLDRQRGSWIVGDGPRGLIQAVCYFLGD